MNFCKFQYQRWHQFKYHSYIHWLVFGLTCLIISLVLFFQIQITFQSLEVASQIEPVKAQNLPAFPGAEGFGAYTVGGRGGRVIKVTNLNSSGPGSLADACAQEGPRIVVFEVSGVIKGDVIIKHPYITIAGQTAPGAGITIDGRLLASGYGLPEPIVYDAVIRFLRVRPTNSQGSGGDAIGLANVDNFILDHISASWACDEVIDICVSTNFTIQWSAIEEGATTGHPEGPHNRGLIAAYNADSISIHHTLFAHNTDRNPLLESLTKSDVRNIVVYNHGEGSRVGFYRKFAAKSPDEVYANIVGNYYKSGPNSKPRSEFPYAFSLMGGNFYMKDNCVDDPDYGVVVFDNPIKAAQNGIPHIGFRMDRQSEDMLLDEPVDTPPVTTHSVLDAYDLVLDKSGCFPRDVVTKRIVQEVREGIGSYGKDIPDDLMEGLSPTAPPLDSDNDGVPDEWETQHGLNSAVDDHNTTMASGYTAIEDYINELAAKLIGQELKTCSAQKGNICQSNQTCSGSWLVASDTNYCCSGQCQIPKPEISLTKSVDKSQAQAGDILTYTITYQNTGQGEAKNVVITDKIPNGTTYISGGDRVESGTVYWEIQSLPAGQTGSLELEVKVE